MYCFPHTGLFRTRPDAAGTSPLSRTDHFYPAPVWPPRHQILQRYQSIVILNEIIHIPGIIIVDHKHIFSRHSLKLQAPAGKADQRTVTDLPRIRIYKIPGGIRQIKIPAAEQISKTLHNLTLGKSGYGLLLPGFRDDAFDLPGSRIGHINPVPQHLQGMSLSVGNAADLFPLSGFYIQQLTDIP